MKTLRIGSRKSQLAQTQTNTIAQSLKRYFPDLDIHIVLMTTRGDLESNGTSAGDNLKAMFTKELEDALLDKRIDIAVHSLKDMAAELPAGLILGAVPEREDPRDAWISKDGTPFAKLGPQARIGTGAVRRQAQIKNYRPDLVLVPMRGNVDTRLRKLKEDNLDGIVLALAGLKRLGREKEATEILSADLVLPAVGQGCLAIECRDRDTGVAPYLKALDHAASHQAALTERALLKGLGGSCQTPIAGLAVQEGNQLTLKAVVLSRDGKTAIRGAESGRAFDAAGIGTRLADKLLELGADKLLS